MWIEKLIVLNHHFFKLYFLIFINVLFRYLLVTIFIIRFDRIWCIGIKNGNIYGYSIKMIIENPILDI